MALCEACHLIPVRDREEISPRKDQACARSLVMDEKARSRASAREISMDWSSSRSDRAARRRPLVVDQVAADVRIPEKSHARESRDDFPQQLQPFAAETPLSLGG